MRAVGTSIGPGGTQKNQKMGTKARSLLTGGLLVAFVGLSYSSVIRRTSQNDLVRELEREIAEEARLQEEEAKRRA